MMQHPILTVDAFWQYHHCFLKRFRNDAVSLKEHACTLVPLYPLISRSSSSSQELPVTVKSVSVADALTDTIIYDVPVYYTGIIIIITLPVNKNNFNILLRSNDTSNVTDTVEHRF